MILILVRIRLRIGLGLRIGLRLRIQFPEGWPRRLDCTLRTTYVRGVDVVSELVLFGGASTSCIRVQSATLPNPDLGD
jgi:hypothetical protein